MKSLVTATSSELPLRCVVLSKLPTLTAPLDCTSIWACDTFTKARLNMLAKQMKLDFFMTCNFSVVCISMLQSYVIKCLVCNVLCKFAIKIFNYFLKKFSECMAILIM